MLALLASLDPLDEEFPAIPDVAPDSYRLSAPDHRPP